MIKYHTDDKINQKSKIELIAACKSNRTGKASRLSSLTYLSSLRDL